MATATSETTTQANQSGIKKMVLGVGGITVLAAVAFGSGGKRCH